MNANLDHKVLYDRWLDIWNGNLTLVDQIVDEGCLIHQAGTETSKEISGPEGIKQMVRMGREPFNPLTFSIEVEPLIDGDRLAARWKCQGDYQGAIPGATVPAGTTVNFGGIDIMRIQSGKIQEYWVSSDGLHLMQQLGAIKDSPCN